MTAARDAIHAPDLGLGHAPSDVSEPLGSALLAELGRALGYHLWLIVIVTVGTVACTYIVFQFINDEYVSTARLLVKLGRENVELPLTVEKGGLLSTGVRKEEINSEIHLIGSRPLTEATVDAVGVDAFQFEPAPPRTWLQHLKARLRALARSVRKQIKAWLIELNLRPRLSQREEAVLLVEQALSVEREKDSDVITVSVRLPSSKLATEVLDTLLGLYLSRRVEVRRDRGISGFFDQQLDTLRRQLEALDASKLTLRDARQITTVDAERALLLGRLQKLAVAIEDNERELRLLAPGGMRLALSDGTAPGAPSAAAAATTVPATSAAPATSASSASSASLASLASLAPLSSLPNVEQLRSKVTELRVQRSDLSQKFTERAEPVLRIDREIAQLEAALAQTFLAQLTALRHAAQAIEQRLQGLNAGEVDLDVIERDRAVLSQNYHAYAKRREEARVSEALDLRRVSNIAVLAQADEPIEPVAPRKLLIIALAWPFGLLAGIGIALFLEYTNPLIRDELDLSPAQRLHYLGPLRTFRGRP